LEQVLLIVMFISCFAVAMSTVELDVTFFHIIHLTSSLLIVAFVRFLSSMNSLSFLNDGAFVTILF
jgi:hypothetical protein